MPRTSSTTSWCGGSTAGPSSATTRTAPTSSPGSPRWRRQGGLTVYAWALLPNHVHLLVRSGTRPLARSMRSLLTGYAGAFNRRHQRRGHLFQNRYKSIVVEEEPYLLELQRQS